MLGYFGAFTAAGLVLRRFVSMPSELFRKILHLISVCSIFILTYGPMSWRSAAIVSCLFSIVIFPGLVLAERIPGFTRFMTERRRGELKRSMIWMFAVCAILICICWGWLGRKYLAVAAISAWGFGDAAAALIGKRFGRRFIVHKLVEGRKTFEGTAAMFVTSFVAVLSVLLANGAMVWYICVPVAVVTAAAAALAELYTLKGFDTVTCPLAAAAVLILTVWL